MFSRSDEISRLIWLTMVAILGLLVSNVQAFWLLFLFPIFVIATDALLFWRVFYKNWKLILLLPISLLIFHFMPLFFLTYYDAGYIFLENSQGMGMLVAGRVFFVVLLSLTFFQITDPRRLAHGLSRLRLPAKWAFAVYLGLRYVSVLRTVARDIKDSMQLRIRHKRHGLISIIKLRARFVFLLVVTSLIKAEQTTLALDTRGFAIVSNRTFIRSHRWNMCGIMLLILMITWTLFVIGWWWGFFFEAHSLVRSWLGQIKG